ncbi:MAG: HAMP domain-containing histidine kinase [Bacteriovoracaceae bacterium]|jgi:signal transduction histidine kinase|nr:HAMP domain-containing histidine kinase [Bacteriovoracaceae bacterium]
MKAAFKSILFNLKSYLVTIFIFTVIWQGYSSFLLLNNLKEQTKENIHQNLANIEKSLSEENLILLKETIWKIKVDNIQKIKFSSASDFNFLKSKLELGEVSAPRFDTKKYVFPVDTNGLNLGSVEIYVNLASLYYYSFSKNIALIFIVSISFIILLIMANLKTSKALMEVEDKLKLLSVGNTDEFEKTINQISENSWAETSGFKRFLSTYLSVVKEKMNLDKELIHFEYRYNIMREVAHGIKSPVHTLNVLKNKLDDKLDDSQKKLFKIACDRINYHANGILLRQNYESEGANYTKTNIKVALERLVELKKAEYQKFSDIKLLSSELNNDVASVSIQSLYEVVSNLINNAYESIEGDQGTIELSSYRENDHIVIECKDSGKGIPESVIEKIWDNNFSWEKRHGSGIGLSLVKKIVETHWKGKCSVTSQINLGTCFKIEIPA